MNAGPRAETNSDAEKRYLVIGSTGYLGVDSVSWDTKTLPNIVDYDIVVVDVRSLGESTLQTISYERLKQIRVALIRLLHSKGTVIVLTDFRRSADPRYPSAGGIVSAAADLSVRRGLLELRMQQWSGRRLERDVAIIRSGYFSIELAM